MARLDLGAPGVYTSPDVPLRTLTGVRMDVCAFAGVAPRGPARVPVVDEKWPDDRPTVEPERPRRRSVAVPVTSFDEYRRLFGGFEGPGLLPYAVASFFEQGGQKAYVVRIVHDYPPGASDPAQTNEGGVAVGTLAGVATTSGGAVALAARSEGTWGDGLRAVLRYRTSPLVFEAAGSTLTSLRLPVGTPLLLGSLLRITLGGGTKVLRFVTDVASDWHPEVSRKKTLFAQLGAPLSSPPEAVEVVVAELALDDGDGRTERHEALGLSSSHPRWMATVLCRESSLVFPDPAWIDADLLPMSALLPVVEPGEGQFAGGLDRSSEIVPDDFFDDDWVLGDEEPRSGVCCLADLEEIALVVAADLYSPRPLVPADNILDVPTTGASFELCIEPPAATPQQTKSDDLDGLRLDPRLPDDLEVIVAAQKRLLDFADALQSFIVLLDVPPGLNQRQMLAWRSRLASMYAAAYHPWLSVARGDDRRDALIRVNPAAVAAGIIASREARFGVPFGPANEVAAGVVNVDDLVSPKRHGELHQANVNVYVREPGGVRLTAARTLSPDPSYRQLSVRRLVTMLRRVLERQMVWMVFEPNNAELRGTVRHMLKSYLRQLWLANAFEGATEDEAFFVRCDDALNTRQVVDAGRLVCEVGVAPAEPLEFLVLRIDRDGDGTLRVEG